MRRVFFILLMMPFFAVKAQQPDIVFHHLTQKDGLSYNLVNGFLKDSKGMLWISTYNGLNKYDGAHFYSYHTGNTKDNLPNNSVHKLAEDKNGNIWGTTDNGAFCLNTKTNKFKSYGTPYQEKWPAVYNVCCDKEGRVWVTNDFCLSVYNPKTDRFELPPFSGKYPDGMIRKNGFAESPDGKGFWLTTRTGLQYYSKQEKKFYTAANSSDTTLINNHNASALCKTSYGHYWYVDNTTKTIIAFDPLKKVVKYRIKVDSTDRVSHGATLFEDNNNVLWYCNWRYELYMIDYLHSNKIRRIQHDKNDVTSIAGDFFWEVMQESDGTLWFGGVGGISKCNLSRNFYKVHRLPAEANTLDNPAIGFITENPFDKTWWTATSKYMLVNYHPLTGQTVLFDLEKFARNKNNNTPGNINKMLFFKDSIFIFGNNGVWLKKGKENFKPFTFPPPYDSWAIRDAVFDARENKMYCLTLYKMLQWNLHTSHVDSIVFNKPVFIKGKPAIISQPQFIKGKVWSLGDFDWLVHNDNNELKALLMNFEDSSEMQDGYYTGTAKDSKGGLWMAKKGDGLIYYNTHNNTSKQFKQHDGLVMDHIMAVAEDGNGKIWSSCYNQFSVYNPLLNSFYNFGLPLSENNYAYVNVMAPLANGNIVGSVAGDMVEFFADRLKTPSIKDWPLISQVMINGVDTNMYTYNNLQLSSNENSLRIKFGMLTDNVATPYDMLYIMEGAEKDWTTASINFEANYNSLPPGDYTFKVKALAKDKSWQTAETILKIHIATPFYKAWWFFILLGLTALATVVIIYRLRMAQKERMMLLESKAQLLEKEKTQVMYENLKQHLNPHFLFNSLTSLSSLIRIDQKQAGSFLDKMSKVYRYILKNRDNETVPLADEIKFVQLYIDLQKTRFEDGLEVNMNIDEEYYNRKIAPVTLQNLVENAIKHNTADLDSPLVIDLFVEDDYLVVKNNLQKKTFVETSNKQGLGNMQSLYRFLSDREMAVEEKDNYFIVKVPLI